MIDTSRKRYERNFRYAFAAYHTTEECDMLYGRKSETSPVFPDDMLWPFAFDRKMLCKIPRHVCTQYR